MKFVFLIFFCFFFIFSVKSQADIWEKEANQLFDKQLYSEAKKRYDTLYKRNIYSEKMLYRLAYICERAENYAEAVYYLRKIQQQYGGEQVDERIILALENAGNSTIYNHQSNKFDERLIRNTLVLMMIIILMSLWAIYLIVKSRYKYARFIGISILIICILPELLLLQAHFFQNPEAIVMQDTAFYEQASFGASSQANLYAPGTSCEILDKEDIWYKVEIHEKVYWLPYFVIKIL